MALHGLGGVGRVDDAGQHLRREDDDRTLPSFSRNAPISFSVLVSPTIQSMTDTHPNYSGSVVTRRHGWSRRWSEPVLVLA